MRVLDQPSVHNQCMYVTDQYECPEDDMVVVQQSQRGQSTVMAHPNGSAELYGRVGQRPLRLCCGTGALSKEAIQQKRLANVTDRAIDAMKFSSC